MELQEDQAKVIKDFCVEMSSSMLRASAEKDFQKDAINNIHEKTGIEKKLLRKMAKAYHKQSFQEETAEQEDFEQLYVTVFGDQDAESDE